MVVKAKSLKSPIHVNLILTIRSWNESELAQKVDLLVGPTSTDWPLKPNSSRRVELSHSMERVWRLRGHIKSTVRAIGLLWACLYIKVYPVEREPCPPALHMSLTIVSLSRLTRSIEFLVFLESLGDVLWDLD